VAIPLHFVPQAWLPDVLHYHSVSLKS